MSEKKEISYKDIHPDFKWNGQNQTKEELQKISVNYIQRKQIHLQEIGLFFQAWFDDNALIEVQTSGSTGKPKKLLVKKQYMVNSALATGNFFELPAKTKALLCLPASYIAGKLMIVRALVLGWHIDSVKPQANPFNINKKYYDFTAITPYQMSQSIDDLHYTEKILVGGGLVSDKLKTKVQNISSMIYESYAMTETLTHIAARPINPRESRPDKLPFKTLNDVNINQDERGCLIIKAPKVSDEIIITNDLVKMINKNAFYLIGRYDNIINSGGIKISPEEIEKEIGKIITQRFFVAGIPDENLGEKLVLIIEGDFSEERIKNLSKSIHNSSLEKYKTPKIIFQLPKFIETHSGKVKRKACIQLIQKNLLN